MARNLAGWNLGQNLTNYIQIDGRKLFWEVNFIYTKLTLSIKLNDFDQIYYSYST